MFSSFILNPPNPLWVAPPIPSPHFVGGDGEGARGMGEGVTIPSPLSRSCGGDGRGGSEACRSPPAAAVECRRQGGRGVTKKLNLLNMKWG